MTYGNNDMNTMHRMSDDDLNYTGFFDGQNKVIPDGTELGVLGCSGCGHGEPAELVREYEAAKTAVSDE